LQTFYLHSWLVNLAIGLLDNSVILVLFILYCSLLFWINFNIFSFHLNFCLIFIFYKSLNIYWKTKGKCSEAFANIFNRLAHMLKVKLFFSSTASVARLTNDVTY